MITNLQEVVAALKQNPTHPVRMQFEDLELEIRAINENRKPSTRTAAGLFRELGPWEGETTEEILKILRDSRKRGAVGRKMPKL